MSAKVAASLAAWKAPTQESLDGIRQNAGIWFQETTVEMCMRSDKYDFELTLLHFEGRASAYQAEDVVEDSYTQFLKIGVSG